MIVFDGLVYQDDVHSNNKRQSSSDCPALQSKRYFTADEIAPDNQDVFFNMVLGTMTLTSYKNQTVTVTMRQNDCIKVLSYSDYFFPGCFLPEYCGKINTIIHKSTVGGIVGLGDALCYGDSLFRPLTYDLELYQINIVIPDDYPTIQEFNPDPYWMRGYYYIVKDKITGFYALLSKLCVNLQVDFDIKLHPHNVTFDGDTVTIVTKFDAFNDDICPPLDFHSSVADLMIAYPWIFYSSFDYMDSKCKTILHEIVCDFNADGVTILQADNQRWRLYSNSFPDIPVRECLNNFSRVDYTIQIDADDIDGSIFTMLRDALISVLGKLNSIYVEFIRNLIPFVISGIKTMFLPMLDLIINAIFKYDMVLPLCVFISTYVQTRSYFLCLIVTVVSAYLKHYIQQFNLGFFNYGKV